MGILNEDPDLETFSDTDAGEVSNWIGTLIPEFDYNLVAGIPASGQISEVFGAPSSGKGHTLDTKFPTPTGKKELKDLKVGDYLFDRMGKPTKILGIYPRGKMDVYEVTLLDGRKVRVNDDHLWTVVTSKNTYIQKTTRQLIDEGIMKDEKHYRHQIPLNSWVMFDSQPVSVDPYVVGALLGDGCLTERKLTLSSNDPFVIKKVSGRLGIKNTAVKMSDYNYNWNFKLEEQGINGRLYIQTKDLLDDILTIPGNTYDKFISNEYIYNTKDVRLELARGLIDTDGHVEGNKGHACLIDWTSMNETLTDQFATLLRSLGYCVNKHHYPRKNRDKSEYELTITGVADELKNLVTLPRQLEVFDKSASNVRLYTKTSIKSIEKLPEQEDISCLYVDNREHLYQVEDFVVTHNTTYAGKITAMATKMGMPVIYFDVEATESKSRLVELGADPNYVKVMQPARQKDGSVKPLTVEQIGQKIIDVLASVHSAFPNTLILFIWDSIAITLSEMQARGEVGEQLVGQQAKALADIGRRVQVNLAQNNGVLLAMNQARDDFNAPIAKYAQVKTTGGKAWEHVLSTRIQFNKSSKIKEKTSDTKAIGNETRVKVPKSKIGDNYDSNFKVALIGETGYDFEWNLLLSGQEHGLITSGAYPKYVDSNGEEHKSKGKGGFVEMLKDPENIEITRDLFQRLLLMFFPKIYQPLFNDLAFMHTKDFPVIKGLRQYYIGIQYNLLPQQQAYNYKKFMEAYQNGDLPDDIAQEAKEGLEQAQSSGEDK